MPQNRILYTLQDIKKILAEKHRINIENVQIYERCTLNLEDGFGYHELESNSFLFQIDK